MKHLYFAAELIEAANLGTSGVDLYIGTIPADVTRGVMLRDPLDGIEIDEGMAGFFSTEFQVIVRDPDAADGHARAEQISTILTRSQLDTTDLFVTRIYPLTLPVQYPRGDPGDVETAVRIRIAFGRK